MVICTEHKECSVVFNQTSGILIAKRHVFSFWLHQMMKHCRFANRSNFIIVVFEKDKQFLSDTIKIEKKKNPELETFFRHSYKVLRCLLVFILLHFNYPNQSLENPPNRIDLLQNHLQNKIDLYHKC